MKNKTSEKTANQTSEFVDPKIDSSLFDQKQNKKAKVIKGKVKIYSNNNKSKHINNGNLNDETELMLISERLLLFLKFTFFFLLLIAFVIFLKKHI